MPPPALVAGDAALADGWADLWHRLAAAVTDRAAALRTPVVATRRGDASDGRLMVVRGVVAERTEIAFFTDRRAAKVADIAGSPGVAVIAYDPAYQLQLRLRGRAQVATAGPAVDAAWAGVAAGARGLYRSASAPGTPAISPAAAALAGDGDGRADFALLTVAVAVVERLDFAAAEHRRAVYDRHGGSWRGRWVTP